MKSNASKIAAVAIALAASVGLPVGQKSAPGWRPTTSKGNKTKNCTGRHVSRRELRKRYDEQQAEGGRGKYALVAGRVRNMKKLASRQ